MHKILLITAIASILAIGLHLLITKILSRFHGVHPATIIFSLLFAVVAHLLEVFIFALKATIYGVFKAFFHYNLYKFAK